MTPDEALFRWATDRPVEHVTAQRDAALETVERNAGPEFAKRAAEFVVQYLSVRDCASGEDITDAAKAAGITPITTDRAFGGVYMSLSVRGVITKCGFVARRKGNLTSGGNLWKLASQ